MTALAKRAAACKGWRWMPGMATLGRSMCVAETGPLFVDLICGSTIPFMVADGFGAPDLDDPATLGCLLALVREAWEGFAVALLVERDGEVRMSMVGPMGGVHWAIKGVQLGEALVAALEAAP